MQAKTKSPIPNVHEPFRADEPYEPVSVEGLRKKYCEAPISLEAATLQASIRLLVDIIPYETDIRRQRGLLRTLQDDVDRFLDRMGLFDTRTENGLTFPPMAVLPVTNGVAEPADEGAVESGIPEEPRRIKERVRKNS